MAAQSDVSSPVLFLSRRQARCLARSGLLSHPAAPSAERKILAFMNVFGCYTPNASRRPCCLAVHAASIGESGVALASSKPAATQTLRSFVLTTGTRTSARTRRPPRRREPQ